MNISNKDQAAITKVVNDYFQGAYHGGETQLRNAFHPDAHIYGLFKGEFVDWTLTDFIAR